MSLLLLSIACMTGCSDGASQITMPGFDPQAAAARAIEAYDQDKNGSISKAEMAASPALQGASKEIDQDGDGALSLAEIESRVEQYVASNTGLQSLSCRATVRGRPLAGAKVKFVPVEFLNEAIGPAEATLRANGSGAVMASGGKLPGLSPGLYRVEVYAPEGSGREIASEYNADSKLWYELNPLEPPALAEFSVEFQ
ncbi:EF-hand domain-containing protein [Aeoliella mucimassa]|uniref:hypothetical protein n=1 Tax=Aeoliella mucimassa TaxID=2527972 RepID=UPI00119FCA29|nr:hypothetical protein [Aeoliella mucimassa]